MKASEHKFVKAGSAERFIKAQGGIIHRDPAGNSLATPTSKPTRRKRERLPMTDKQLAQFRR